MDRHRPSPLRVRRLLRGLRLCDLARATGITTTMLSALELGQERLRGHRLARLAAFYATPPAALVDGMRRWTAHLEDPRHGAPRTRPTR